jgi:hypothetical protein
VLDGGLIDEATATPALATDASAGLAADAATEE